MKKVEWLAIGLAVMFASTPFLAHARNCELPHEKLQAKCGGEGVNFFDAEATSSNDNLDAVSGVQKTRKTARQLLAEYRSKAQEYDVVVQKAKDDYKDYLATKGR